MASYFFIGVITMIDNISGVVLTGGKSSRMGVDKMALQHNNTTFLENAVDALSIFSNIYISVSKVQQNNVLIQKVLNNNIKLAVDKYDDIGPLGGLATTLPILPTEYAFVCACDMPNLNRHFIEQILGDIDTLIYDAYIAVSDRGKEPLCSIYSKKCLPSINQSIDEQQYSINSMLARCKVKLINLSDSKHIENVNTPSEYQKISRG